MSTSPNLAK